MAVKEHSRELQEDGIRLYAESGASHQGSQVACLEANCNTLREEPQDKDLMCYSVHAVAGININVETDVHPLELHTTSVAKKGHFSTQCFSRFVATVLSQRKRPADCFTRHIDRN